MATVYGDSASRPFGPLLTSAACRAALRDPAHLFRAMWAARRESSEQSPQCWDVPRRRTNTTGPPGEPEGFDERVLSGSACRRGRFDENWYNGVHHWPTHVRLVRDTVYTHRRPAFTAPALGLLGFDDSFEQRCGSETVNRLGAPTACAVANLNVLSIEERRYNLCRNLEWQACAARGLLPGQGGSGIVFSVAPGSLLLPKYEHSPSLRRTFGVCGGPLPNSCRACTYANDDIFFLEVCLFDQICLNGPDIFRVKTGERFECVFSPEGFTTLMNLLRQPVEAANTSRRTCAGSRPGLTGQRDHHRHHNGTLRNTTRRNTTRHNTTYGVVRRYRNSSLLQLELRKESRKESRQQARKASRPPKPTVL